MSNDIAIQINGLKKMYKLGQIGGGTLQGDLQSWWASIRGKEDPNSKIGADQRSNGKTFMALNGIDLTVHKGEALGIIGGNGAGKSTMLKILSRVTAPSEGEVCINGRIASMLEVGTGFNGEMTGRENIYMNGAILGMTKTEVDSKMEQIIDFSECREFIDTPVKRYSSGMYVKLAFSVAAHLDAEIMIMDEVLAVGDMAFQKKCLTKMKEAAAQEGRTVLYVSHNMNTIRQLCDRCVVLHQGRVIFNGDVEDAIQVYMMNNIDIAKNTFNDYSAMVRLKHLRHKRDIDLVSCEILNNTGCNFSKNEPIYLKLKWRVNHPIENVFLRIEYRYADETPVGASVMYKAINPALGEIVLESNISQLANGNYRALIVIYEMNDVGKKRDIDAVWPAFSFTKEVVTNIEWEGRYWGYVELPPIRVLNRGEHDDT